MYRTVLLLGAVVLLLLGAFFYIAGTPVTTRSDQTTQDPVVGHWQDGGNKPAPDFTLATLRGDTLRLSDLRGRIVVLNFWATWCAPCRIETPEFVALQEVFKNWGVQFVGLSVDEEGFDVVRPFAEAYGINYPVVVDDGTVAARYEGITGYPTTYLINRRGEITHYMPGMLTQETLRPVLVELLEAEVAR